MSRSASPALTEAVRFHRAGHLTQAVERYQHVVATEPPQPAVFFQLGLALRALRRDAEAVDAFQRVIALQPQLAEPHHQRGLALKRLGRLGEALASLAEATRLDGSNAAAWLNYGAAALDAADAPTALAAIQRAVALEPQRPEAHNILGVALHKAGQLTAARAALQEALRLRPDYAAAHDNLGRLAKAEGDLSDAITHYRAALASAPNPTTHSNLLFALNFVVGPSPTEIFAEHREWNTRYARTLAPASQPQPQPRAARTGQRLRIGYVSPDFAHHAVAYFIAPVLAAHDRSRFEVFCYANVPAPDRVTARLRQLADHWRDIAPLSDDAAAQIIRSDEIDVLIDLAGHTARHRLLLFARRPAPIQATWIGYPNTTGLDAIDFRFTDAISDPPGVTDGFHSEKLVRLPGPFSCYEPDPAAPEVSAPPLTKNPDVVTFGCFNNFAKISPPVIETWTRILQQLPSSRLFLKSRGLNDSSTAARLRHTFAAAGISPDRILLNGDELSVEAHLSLYRQVDVALDPFPYNGTTTTCEALWMGVPVITLAGETHVARVGASLLTHLGLSEWIAATPDAYVARALAAANDLPRLVELRRTLRERLRHSPLCDANNFTRNFEAALLQIAAPASAQN